MILAEVHTTDFNRSVKFDATIWFEEASSAEVKALALEGWRGWHWTGNLVEHMREFNSEVDDLVAYTRTTNKAIRFECSVNKDDALAWLKRHRRVVYWRLNKVLDSVTV